MQPPKTLIRKRSARQSDCHETVTRSQPRRLTADRESGKPQSRFHLAPTLWSRAGRSAQRGCLRPSSALSPRAGSRPWGP